MKKIFIILIPLFIFSYYDFSLRKDAQILELTEDPYIDYYLNPAILGNLKERFINFGIYGSSGKAQFAYINFLNPNKILPYALVFANFETPLSSEKSFSFLFSSKRKGYSYGFKFHISKIKNFYEELFRYQKEEYNLEREGPIGDSNPYGFYFEDYYFLEIKRVRKGSYYQNESNLLLLPLAFYLKFKDLEAGVDFQNSIEKKINKKEKEERTLEVEEEYEWMKEGDTLLISSEERLRREEVGNINYEREIENLKSWEKAVALFLRKKIKGIKDRKIIFGRIGYSSEIVKGDIYQMSFNETYEIFSEWEKSYEQGYLNYDSSSSIEEKREGKEEKRMIKKEKENIYQEGGFGFNYYYSLLKFNNTLFLGIKEKIDFIKTKKTWDKRGRIYFHLGNNFEIGKFSFFPIFTPYFTIEEDTLTYNYQCFFDTKLKLFDFLNCRFSYLLPGEKEIIKKWTFSLSLNF